MIHDKYIHQEYNNRDLVDENGRFIDSEVVPPGILKKQTSKVGRTRSPNIDAQPRSPDIDGQSPLFDSKNFTEDDLKMPEQLIPARTEWTSILNPNIDIDREGKGVSMNIKMKMNFGFQTFKQSKKV